MRHPLVRPSGNWMRDALPDEEVVDRVRNGELELFELLMRRHNQRLFRTVRSIVLDDGEAEDALQTAYVSAWQALDSFAGRSSFITWMTRIAIRSARALVAGRRRRNRLEEVASGRAAPPPASTPDESASRGEMEEFLTEAIDALPENYRLVFVLRTLQGLSTREVAEDLGITEGTVKIRLHRAREAVRDRFLGLLEEDPRLSRTWSFAGHRCDRVVAGTFERIRSSQDTGKPDRF